MAESPEAQRMSRAPEVSASIVPFSGRSGGFGKGGSSGSSCWPRRDNSLDSKLQKSFVQENYGEVPI